MTGHCKPELAEEAFIWDLRSPSELAGPGNYTSLKRPKMYSFSV